MARTVGISLRSVQRIWEAHRLQPHRVRTFKRSRDPKFTEKLVDVVGLSIPKTKPTEAELPLTDPSQQFDPGYGDRRGFESFEPKHRADPRLHAPMVLLDQVVQVLR